MLAILVTFDGPARMGRRVVSDRTDVAFGTSGRVFVVPLLLAAAFGAAGGGGDATPIRALT
eukprot:5486128-Prorocentrum_lima.AAC.1